MSRKVKNFKGFRQGRLTLVRHDGYNQENRALWYATCECGGFATVRPKYGAKSCGCLYKIQMKKNGIRRKQFQDCGDVSGTYLARVKHSASKRGLEFDLSPEYCEEIFTGFCNLSGIRIENLGRGRKTASLDRIDSSKGYVKGNVQWLHKDINKMKLDHEENYFISLCVKVSEKRSGV